MAQQVETVDALASRFGQHPFGKTLDPVDCGHPRVLAEPRQIDTNHLSILGKRGLQSPLVTAAQKPVDHDKGFHLR